MKCLLLAVAFALVALAPACSSSEPDESATESTPEALSGCHQVCPHCSGRPGTECPLSPCYLKCADPNGHDVCPETQLCIQGYTWQPKACKCAPTH